MSLCMEGKYRMFDCSELKNDGLTKLKNTYLAWCIPVEHDLVQNVNQVQVQVQERPCYALVMNAEGQREGQGLKTNLQ